MRPRWFTVCGWAVSLTLSAAISVLAACGGSRATAPASPAASVTADQAALLRQLPNLKNEAEPLATLVSQKELSSDEIRTAIISDPQFADTETLGVKAGFGPAQGGFELAYDNDTTVTAALLTSPDRGIALAAREAGTKPSYAVLHLSPDGKTLTVYHPDSTITLDVETLKGSAVDAPEAEHSCRVGHCIYAAVVYLFQTPVFGTALKAVCGACVAAVAALPATVTASAVVAIPACIGCFPALTSMGLAALTDCEIDPCDYCADDSCGESEYTEMCTPWAASSADPVTGSWAGVDGIRTGYHCEGVKVTTFPIPKVDYSATQCTYGSELTGLVQACPYGCASPAPGDTVSRDCNTAASWTPSPSPSPSPTPAASPTPQCRRDSDCPVGPRQDIACSPMSGGGWMVTQEYTYYYCWQGQCLPDLRREGVPCPGACSADGVSCAGSPTPTPIATPIPTPTPLSDEFGQVSAAVWVRASADTFIRCANCQVRLTGIGGTYTATSDAAGAVSFHTVHYGNYAVQRSCRERQEAQWVTVWEPALNPSSLTVPTQATVNIELAQCPGPNPTASPTSTPSPSPTPTPSPTPHPTPTRSFQPKLGPMARRG